MANIYTIAAPATPFLPNRCMIGLFNGPGSGRVVRVYRVSALNAQTVAVTGVNSVFNLTKISTGSGGLYLTPTKHDSQSPLVPAQIVAATNMSYTASSTFRRLFWSNDEPLLSTAGSIDEFQTIPRMMNLWESSYSEQNVQPITLREGQGLALINNTNTNVGVADFFMEFTVETS